MRRIAIINQKGGVGKTATTANLGAALAQIGRRVLLIDLDPQAHLTLHVGLDPSSDRPSAYDMLTRSERTAAAQVQIGENLWAIGSRIDLAAAEVELAGVVGREMILRDLLDQDGREYDFILMDSPPSLGLLTLNGLTAADEVFIPLQPHYLALQGLGKLLETVSLVRARINPTLRVSGVIVCIHEPGTRLGIEVLEEVQRFLGAARGTGNPWADAVLFDSRISRNIKLAECPSHGKTIFDYAPRSRGACDYMMLAHEVVGEPAQELETEAASPDHAAPTGGNGQPAEQDETAAAARDAAGDTKRGAEVHYEEINDAGPVVPLTRTA